MNVESFKSYLRRPNASANLLVDWLQGYGMMQGPQPEMPYIELHRVLNKAPDSTPLALALSHRLARILGSGVDELVAKETAITRPRDRIQRFEFKIAGDNSHPEEMTEVTWPSEMTANALFLASSLRYLDSSWPERVAVLAPPIKKLYTDRKLSGSWLGTPLSEPLRSGVMTNQTDESLLETWQQTMHGRPDSFLGGQIWDGFRGIVLVPGGGLENPQPMVKEIAEGLKLVKSRLSGQHDGMRDYDFLLSETARVWSQHPSLKNDLLSLVG